MYCLLELLAVVSLVVLLATILFAVSAAAILVDEGMRSVLRLPAQDVREAVSCRVTVGRRGPLTVVYPGRRYDAVFPLIPKPYSRFPRVAAEMQFVPPRNTHVNAARRVPGRSLLNQVSRRPHVGRGPNGSVMSGGEPHEVASGPHNMVL